MKKTKHPNITNMSQQMHTRIWYRHTASSINNTHRKNREKHNIWPTPHSLHQWHTAIAMQFLPFSPFSPYVSVLNIMKYGVEMV